MLEKAKRKLVGSLQEELQHQGNSANVKKEIRKDTIGQLFQFLGQNELYTPNPEELIDPVIPISVL